MAAERSTDFETTPVPNNAFAEERSRLEKAYADKGLSVKLLMNDLKVLMWESVGVIREKSGLVQALDHLRDTLPRVAVSGPTDLIKLLELQNMRCVSEMVCRAALERTESRGFHFRSDYPAEDNRIWLKILCCVKAPPVSNLKPSL